MKRVYIESRGALQYIRAVLNIADQIDYTMNYRPSECWGELRRRREHVARASEIFRDTEFLPCGYQDAAGDRLSAAIWNANVYLDAMIICKGRVSRRLQSTIDMAWS